MQENVVTAKVLRFNPHKDKVPKYELYMVQSDRSISVLNLLHLIHQNLDRTLAYRNYFCHLGVCLSCLLHIDGKNLKGCTKTVNPGDTVTIEPPKGYTVIRDLVVSFGVKRNCNCFST
jgi:succinate dehydrogenase/fumarate reductase-like Fe-S protein